VETAVDHLIAAGLSMERYESFDQDERGIAHGNGPKIARFLPVRQHHRRAERGSEPAISGCEVAAALMVAMTRSAIRPPRT